MFEFLDQKIEEWRTNGNSLTITIDLTERFSSSTLNRGQHIALRKVYQKYTGSHPFQFERIYGSTTYQQIKFGITRLSS